jgi:uncharacterized integral membrane protein
MNFIDLSETASTSLSYISKVFDDTLPILIIVFGLIIGFFIIGKIVEIVRGFSEREIPEGESESDDGEIDF